MLNTLTKTKQSKVSQLSQKNLGYGGSWKAQWTNAFRTEIVTYFSRYNIDATDYRVPTDQLLTEANEVLETGTKLNAHYKANSISLLLGYQVNETGMLNQTTVSAPSYSSTKRRIAQSCRLYGSGIQQRQQLFKTRSA
jgi:hypothetical protein